MYLNTIQNIFSVLECDQERLLLSCQFFCAIVYNERVPVSLRQFLSQLHILSGIEIETLTVTCQQT